MQCPQCNVDVPPGSSFCVHCGRRSQNACPNCGTLYAADNKYCRTCGTQLTEPLGAATTATPAPIVQVTCPRCHGVNEPGASFCYSCGLPFDEEKRPRPATVFPVGRPAGFWIRVVAFLIDGGVLLLVLFVVGALWPGANALDIQEPLPEASSAELTELDLTWTALDTVALIMSVAYYTLSIAIWSTTVGKRLVGIYVFRPDGSRVGVARAFCRYLAGQLSFLLFFIGYLMVAFRRDKRGLHDLICDTVVVYRQ